MNEDARRRLEDLLDREIDIARVLAATLDAERGALTGASAEAVQLKAAEKMQLLGTIEKLEDERRALSVAAGQGLPGTRIPRGTGIAETVAARWRTLMELMAGCRTANEVNGYIINLRRSQVNQLLGIVRGGSPVTYNPQGKTFAKALRALAKA
ncbi:MAG TPA: flagellar protein FlgN [Steroidobacteraceae bacterium]|jgi:flagellar biosynthesis/type III secretory pathway chaperone|nr:flagellar protein FlgN [Steroidobacteraceae bacterium]